MLSIKLEASGQNLIEIVEIAFFSSKANSQYSGYTSHFTSNCIAYRLSYQKKFAKAAEPLNWPTFDFGINAV